MTYNLDLTIFTPAGAVDLTTTVLDAADAFSAADEAITAYAAHYRVEATDVAVNRIADDDHMSVIIAHVAQTIAVNNDPTLAGIASCSVAPFSAASPISLGLPVGGLSTLSFTTPVVLGAAGMVTLQCFQQDNGPTNHNVAVYNGGLSAIQVSLTQQ